jgi:hypothetical protein
VTLSVKYFLAKNGTIVLQHLPPTIFTRSHSIRFLDFSKTKNCVKGHTFRVSWCYKNKSDGGFKDIAINGFSTLFQQMEKYVKRGEEYIEGEKF